jgi:hypothetical protein
MSTETRTKHAYSNNLQRGHWYCSFIIFHLIFLIYRYFAFSTAWNRTNEWSLIAETVKSRDFDSTTFKIGLASFTRAAYMILIIRRAETPPASLEGEFRNLEILVAVDLTLPYKSIPKPRALSIGNEFSKILRTLTSGFNCRHRRSKGNE